MDVLYKRGYTNLIKIDSGGQARVYKAEHVPDGQIVAIKIVHVENPNNTKLDDDLKRELQIISNLQHPNCIKIHKLLRSQGKVYIVMDFMPNGNIGSRVRNDGELCEWHARLWFCPIARAVKYLHEHKIAHRDLKLDNILLDIHWNPILTDFGFSRFVPILEDGSVQKSHTYCGTPSYNPPEILKQIPYDPFMADIWCLGVMLFIMINKTYPFDKSDREKMYEAQLEKRYKLRDVIEMKSSPDVKDLIDRLLEPQPELRPNIFDVCSHPWFPLILRENEFIVKRRSPATATAKTPTPNNDAKQPASPLTDYQQQLLKQQQQIFNNLTKSPGIDNAAARHYSVKYLNKAFKIKQPPILTTMQKQKK